MSQPIPSSRSPFSIVVGLTFTDGGNYAFDQAALIARGIPSAEIHLVHVFEEGLSLAQAEDLKQHLSLFATDKAASLQGLEKHSIGIHLRVGEPARALVDFARESGASMIVLGSEKHGVKAWFASPTAEKLIASAPCPVVVAGPRPAAAAAGEPVIEPACGDCVSTRRATGGDQWWCARHSEHARTTHTFSYKRELPFATHDSQLGPTGV
jgi:nucleotide-binding universal stress UspA family protein